MTSNIEKLGETLQGRMHTVKKKQQQRFDRAWNHFFGIGSGAGSVARANTRRGLLHMQDGIRQGNEKEKRLSLAACIWRTSAIKN